MRSVSSALPPAAAASARALMCLLSCLGLVIGPGSALAGEAEPKSEVPAARDAETTPPAGGAETGPPGAPAADAVASPWSGSAGLYSQYVSRGVSYTSERPAVQLNGQYTAASGAYFGLWESNVSSDFLHDATLETDPYGGIAGSLGDFAYDFGFWRWTFLGASLPTSHQKYDTIELYAGGSWKALSLKYWQEVTDYFGLNSLSAADWGVPANGSSRGSHYLEGSLSTDLGHGLALSLHYGRQVVHHYDALSFGDWRLQFDQDLGAGWGASLAWSDTNADPRAYPDAKGLNTARGKLYGSIHRSF